MLTSADLSSLVCNSFLLSALIYLAGSLYMGANWLSCELTLQQRGEGMWHSAYKASENIDCTGRQLLSGETGELDTIRIGGLRLLLCSYAFGVQVPMAGNKFVVL